MTNLLVNAILFSHPYVSTIFTYFLYLTLKTMKTKMNRCGSDTLHLMI